MVTPRRRALQKLEEIRTSLLNPTVLIVMHTARRRALQKLKKIRASPLSPTLVIVVVRVPLVCGSSIVVQVIVHIIIGVEIVYG